MSAAARQPMDDPQDGLFDSEIDNDVLETTNRPTTRPERRPLHGAAQAHLAELELDADTVIRCGRFRIKTTTIPAKSVSFETDPSTRTTISLLDEV